MCTHALTSVFRIQTGDFKTHLPKIVNRAFVKPITRPLTGSKKPPLSCTGQRLEKGEHVSALDSMSPATVFAPLVLAQSLHRICIRVEIVI